MPSVTIDNRSHLIQLSKRLQAEPVKMSGTPSMKECLARQRSFKTTANGKQMPSVKTVIRKARIAVPTWCLPRHRR